jgi:hypothetical protein
VERDCPAALMSPRAIPGRSYPHIKLGIENDARDGQGQNAVMLFDSLSGHHILKDLVITKDLSS